MHPFDGPMPRTLIYDNTGTTSDGVRTEGQEPTKLRISTSHLVGAFFVELASY